MKLSKNSTENVGTSSQELEYHADFIVKRLEQFIRDGRIGGGGVSFKKWQNIAKYEIIKSIFEVKNQQYKDSFTSHLLVFSSAAVMVTIGFWGAAVSLGKADYLLAALICFVSGISLLLGVVWGRFKNYRKFRHANKCFTSLNRIGVLFKRIKKLERELESEEKKRQEEVKSVRNPNGKSLYESLLQ